MEDTKKTFLFLRGPEFWPTFDTQICITLAIFWEKLKTLESPQKSLKIHQHSHQ